MIHGKNFFDHPININLKTYENIRKIATGQGDDYTMIAYIINYYKMIAIDLSKQQVFDADPREIQQINLTVNLDRAGNTTMFFITEESKETVLDFSQGTVKVNATLKKSEYNSIKNVIFISKKWRSTTV